jgi:hypothetical protein
MNGFQGLSCSFVSGGTATIGRGAVLKPKGEKEDLHSQVQSPCSSL